MMGYTRLVPGPGFEAGRAALYYSQRMVIFPVLRRAVSRGIATGINIRHAWSRLARNRRPAGAKLRKIPDHLARDGYAMLPGLVDVADLAEIESFVRTAAVVGKHGPPMPLADLPPGTSMASYPLAAVLGCSAILRLVNSPVVLGLAGAYLGCKPTLSSIGLRWSLPRPDQTMDTQQFHRDPDDWRFLKLFIYLTDVGPDGGPHIYIAGSQRTTGQIRAHPYTLDGIKRRYGGESVRTVTGPAGTAFLADTYGIHRGAPPISGPRLLLQAQYSLLPVYAFRYEPVTLLPRPAVDPYINRLLLV